MNGFVRIRAEVLACLDCGMIEYICENSLLKFVSDVIVERKFRKYFKGIKCKFTNLSSLLKNI